ncbi:cytochrome o ubiquinol oxidase subunit III [Aquicella lusitana]|uniref:Cytochrome bo(3) ubiquinol oxidase subunit 3 n=1 Tax=Aquicella lusitana TaxID=254246 RepID=A0A370GJI5_9COXI|nr:cytochrome o ubiquinol oxidase subunit III [Aquicella lusitana]RDI43399.1 cytochrome bo3 quinol oxidase subunit 3 [Aquicella lusitana]VVC73549.1 Cytochrome bo(3) ubiquinol oxidase subunit 3 [Aquicella lusitana]
MAHSLTYHHHNTDEMDIFGFWIYILTDCILFASIFATYAVLQTSVYGGPTIKELVNIPYILIETMTLLASSFTYGLAILALYKNKPSKVIGWLAITFLFGALFVGMEVSEFANLYNEGHTWQSSAALSAFFTLVGTHGLHVTIGLLWMLVLMVQLLKFGLTDVMRKRLTYLGLFWAFLDIIWIFVFTIVYLMGAI